MNELTQILILIDQCKDMADKMTRLQDADSVKSYWNVLRYNLYTALNNAYDIAKALPTRS